MSVITCDIRIRHAAVMGELLGCMKQVKITLDNSPRERVWTNHQNMYHHHHNEGGTWRLRDSYTREEPDSLWTLHQNDVDVLNDWLRVLVDHIERPDPILHHITGCCECRHMICPSLQNLIYETDDSTSSETATCPTSAP